MWRRGSQRPAAKHRTMIALTRLDGRPFVLNCDLIESVEATPDTVVTLTSGNKLIVRDTPQEVQAKVIAFKKQIHDPN